MFSHCSLCLFSKRSSESPSTKPWSPKCTARPSHLLLWVNVLDLFAVSPDYPTLSLMTIWIGRELLKYSAPSFQLTWQGVRCLFNASLYAEMTCSLLCRTLVWSRALSKSGLVSSQWITLPSTEPVQSCRLSLALEKLFSALTLLVCAETFSDVW